MDVYGTPIYAFAFPLLSHQKVLRGLKKSYKNIYASRFSLWKIRIEDFKASLHTKKSHGISSEWTQNQSLSSFISNEFVPEITFKSIFFWRNKPHIQIDSKVYLYIQIYFLVYSNMFIFFNVGRDNNGMTCIMAKVKAFTRVLIWYQSRFIFIYNVF